MTQVTIEKWGRSLALRLPEEFLAELCIRTGDSLRATVIDGKCYLEPVKSADAPNPDRSSAQD